MTAPVLRDFSWERMIAAVEDVRERARRAANALRNAGIPHDKDKVHLRDLMDVGLLDSTWCDRLPPPLAARLKEVIDARNAEGVE